MQMVAAASECRLEQQGKKPFQNQIKSQRRHKAALGQQHACLFNREWKAGWSWWMQVKETSYRPSQAANMNNISTQLSDF